MHLIVTRPEEDAGPLKSRLEALGHEVTLAPLLRIVAREGIDIPDLDYQLAVATSANGVRSLQANDHVKSIRILTVGPQSLKAAQESGFGHAEAQGGDVARLAAYIIANFRPEAGPILYLSGAETAGDLQGNLQTAGFEVDRFTLYDAVPANSLGAAAEELRQQRADAVLLYSPRTARMWAALVDAEDLEDVAAVPLYLCLSENVAAALPDNWHRHVAEAPQDNQMIALLEQIQGTR
jgi:uroporphyrinogen-III synthase